MIKPPPQYAIHWMQQLLLHYQHRLEAHSLISQICDDNTHPDAEPAVLEQEFLTLHAIIDEQPDQLTAKPRARAPGSNTCAAPTAQPKPVPAASARRLTNDQWLRKRIKAAQVKHVTRQGDSLLPSVTPFACEHTDGSGLTQLRFYAARSPTCTNTGAGGSNKQAAFVQHAALAPSAIQDHTHQPSQQQADTLHLPAAAAVQEKEQQQQQRHQPQLQPMQQQLRPTRQAAGGLQGTLSEPAPAHLPCSAAAAAAVKPVEQVGNIAEACTPQMQHVSSGEPSALIAAAAAAAAEVAIQQQLVCSSRCQDAPLEGAAAVVHEDAVKTAADVPTAVQRSSGAAAACDGDGGDDNDDDDDDELSQLWQAALLGDESLAAGVPAEPVVHVAGRQPAAAAALPSAVVTVDRDTAAAGTEHDVFSDELVQQAQQQRHQQQQQQHQQHKAHLQDLPAPAQLVPKVPSDIVLNNSKSPADNAGSSSSSEGTAHTAVRQQQQQQVLVAHPRVSDGQLAGLTAAAGRSGRPTVQQPAVQAESLQADAAALGRAQGSNALPCPVLAPSACRFSLVSLLAAARSEPSIRPAAASSPPGATAMAGQPAGTVAVFGQALSRKQQQLQQPPALAAAPPASCAAQGPAGQLASAAAAALVGEDGDGREGEGQGEDVWDRYLQRLPSEQQQQQQQVWKGLQSGQQVGQASNSSMTGACGGADGGVADAGAVVVGGGGGAVDSVISEGEVCDHRERGAGAQATRGQQQHHQQRGSGRQAAAGGGGAGGGGQGPGSSSSCSSKNKKKRGGWQVRQRQNQAAAAHQATAAAAGGGNASGAAVEVGLYKSIKAHEKRAAQHSSSSSNKRLKAIVPERDLRFATKGSTTQLCKFWLGRGSCRNGSACPYIHGSQCLTAFIPCKFHNRGCCTKGDSCGFSHQPPHSQICMRQVHYGLCNHAASGRCRFSHQIDQLGAEVLLGLKQLLAKDEAFLQQLEAEDSHAATTAAGSLSQQQTQLSNRWHQQAPLLQQQQDWAGSGAAPAHMAVLLRHQHAQQQDTQQQSLQGNLAAGLAAGDVAPSKLSVANGVQVEHF